MSSLYSYLGASISIGLSNTELLKFKMSAFIYKASNLVVLGSNYWSYTKESA